MIREWEKGGEDAARRKGVLFLLAASSCSLLSLSELSAQEVVRERAVLAPTFLILEEGGAEQGVSDVLRSSVHKGVQGYLWGYPDLFETTSREELSDAVRAQEYYEQGLKRARASAKIGVERYKGLSMAEAIEWLTRAKEGFGELGHELVAPLEVGEVLLYLALSHVEAGETRAALSLFRELVLLDPDRELRDGYYPRDVVATYEIARANLMTEIARSMTPPEVVVRAKKIARYTEADSVATGFVIPTEKGGWEVTLLVWTREENEDEIWRDTIPLEPGEGGDLAAASVEAAASRLAGRWIDCMRLAEVETEVSLVEVARGTSPIRVDLGFVYGTFLQFPNLQSIGASLSREVERNSGGGLARQNVAHFGNYGLDIGVAWSIRREFALVGHVQFLVSQGEYNSLLSGGEISTVRGLIGAELVTRKGRWSLGTQIAADLTHLSDFDVFEDPSCVTPEDACALGEGRARYTEHDVQIGINIAPLVSFRITPAISIRAQTSLSYFFYSSVSERSDQVNLPWMGHIGLQYRL